MALSSADFELVCALVRTHSGVTVAPDKAYLATSRLEAVASSEGLLIADLLDRLRSSAWPDLRRRVAESMLIGETSFFRDPASFDALRQLLPALATAAGARPLRIWSAGCSTGQEPYSLALLVLQHLPALAAGGLEVIATDVSEAHLARASEGVYSSLEVNRGLPASVLIRHFDQRGRDWSVNDSVRRMVSFHRVSLLAELPPAVGRVDVVWLRNVLIYFEVQDRRSILTRVRHALRPGGPLFLGAAETLSGVDAHFESVAIDRSVYYRVREESHAHHER
jgi:chemotaxis protein methyltransferase CheR